MSAIYWVSSQVVLFFNEKIVRPELFLEKLETASGGLFTKPPIIMPVPADPALDDIPNVNYSSDDGRSSLFLARTRCGLTFSSVGNNEDFLGLKDSFVEIGNKLFDVFLTKYPIKRIGFVSTYFVVDNDAVAKVSALVGSKFKDLFTGTVHETNIRLNTRDKMLGFDINNIVSIETGTADIMGVGKQMKGLVIKRDINTIPETDYHDTFSRGIIGEFVNQAEIVVPIGKVKRELYGE